MKKSIYIVFTYLFPILMLDYYLILRGLNLNTIIVLPIFFVLTVLAVKIGVTNSRDSFIQSMNIFLGYSLLTGMFYAFNDAPFSCYIDTLRSFVFPIIFAYLGCKYSKDNEFNKWYIYGCAFCFIIGFYLFLEAPSYYVRFIFEARENAFNARFDLNEANIMDYTRFSSFFTTSYAISCLSIPALILSLSYALKSKNGILRIFYYVVAVSSFVAAFLCQQRIAMGSSIVVAVFWIFYSRKLTNTRGSVGILLAYIAILILSLYVLGLIISYEWFGRVSDQLTVRWDQMEFGEAMGMRTGQYLSFNRQTDFSFFFGLGLGSCGHAAVAHGLKAIADGEFIKLFYEFGIVGMILLACVILPTLLRGIKFFKLYYVEVVIILFYLAAGIAADSLTLFIFSIMFWYSLGRIWNKEYYKTIIKKNDIEYGNK